MSHTSKPVFFQRELFPDLSLPSINRPIHYLGSKLRIRDLISGILDKIDPSKGPVCDLFAGSGTVASHLSKERDVIAIDIQEYSRVICSALLNPVGSDDELILQFMRDVQSSNHSELLKNAIEPLADFEERCLSMASTGNLEPLCDLLEHGSLIAFELGACESNDPHLLSALKESSIRLHKFGFIDTPQALVARYFGGIYFSYLQAAHLDTIL